MNGPRAATAREQPALDLWNDGRRGQAETDTETESSPRGRDLLPGGLRMDTVRPDYSADLLFRIVYNTRPERVEGHVAHYRIGKQEIRVVWEEDRDSRWSAKIGEIEWRGRRWTPGQREGWGRGVIRRHEAERAEERPTRLTDWTTPSTEAQR